MFGKVLVLSVSCGYGHTRVGQVLEEELKLAGCCGEVKHIDVLDYTNALLRGIHHKVYFRLSQELPHLVGMSYDISDKEQGNVGLSLLIDRLMTRPFKKLLLEESPDLIVCTHFLPARIAQRQREKGRISCPIVTVVTDYYAHSLWRTLGLDHYFVPTEEVKAEFAGLGVEADRITASGIPISRAFAAEKNQREMQEKHGLSPQLPTLLLTAGGQGFFPMDDLIGEVASFPQPVQAVVVCGKNAEAKEDADAAVGELPLEVAKRFHVLGFTKEMDELMSAADVLIGKPGGLTTSEALARGVVFAVVKPIPGQEDRNTELLLESGAGMRCRSLRNLGHKLQALLAEPERMRQMKAASRRMGKPLAAQTVVETIRKCFDR